MIGFIYLSVICGSLFALLANLLLRSIIPELAVTLSVSAGFLFGSILFLALLVHDKWMNRKYFKFESTIQSRIFFKTSGNFNLGGLVRNGRIYFCDDGIMCASLDESPQAVEAVETVQLQRIERYAFDHIHMNIYIDDGRVFLITTPDAPKILEILKKRDWIA